MPTYGPNTPSTFAQANSGHPVDSIQWLASGGGAAAVAQVQLLDGVYIETFPWQVQPPEPAPATQEVLCGSNTGTLSNLGFAIPTNEVITNISVSFYKMMTEAADRIGGTSISDYLMGIVVDGVTSVDKAAGTWPDGVITEVVYSDTPAGWGVSSDPADFNSSSFAVFLACRGVGGPVPLPLGGAQDAPHAYVDQVTVTIETVAVQGIVSTFSIIPNFAYQVND